MIKKLFLSVLVAVCFISAVFQLNFQKNCVEAAAADNEPQIDIVYNSSKMEISWAPVAQASSYEIQRAGSRLGEYTTLETVNGLSYTDNNPNPEKYENYYKVIAKDGQDIISEKLISLELKMFGENTKIYDIKYDNIADIATEINSIHDNEMFGSIVEDSVSGRRAEFSSKRYAMYFKPGDYSGFDTFRIGFYTHIAGLGSVPAETTLFGSIKTPAHLSSNNATCTFWRTIENFQISGSGIFQWGVSQAAPARRMKVNVTTQFDMGGYASGGFASDCYFGAAVGSSSQQQWYTRNSTFTRSMNGVSWNNVIQGATGPVPGANFATGGSVSIVDKTPIVREKPFLYLDDGEYKVFLPALKRDSAGVSWSDTDMGEGESLDLDSKFYIARPEKDNAQTLNSALESGKNIFFSPGRYELEKPLHIKRAGTVVLGTALATLIPGPTNTYGAIYIEDVPGVTVAGLMLDALHSSTYLLAAGDRDSNLDHSQNPTLLADLFLRIGGYTTENVHADIAAMINSNNVIGDHFWVWRADHGSGVGWDKNTSKNGLVVTGDDMTFYGLFVEHFHEYNTLWLGENGRTYFYQNELPYDPLNQESYMSHNGSVNGYAAYKVGNNVDKHFAIGMGSYAVFNKTGPGRNKGESVFVENAIEVPNKEEVMIQNVCIVELTSTGGELTGVNSIINGAGDGFTSVGYRRNYLASYNNGTAVTPSSKKTGIQPADEDFDLPSNADLKGFSFAPETPADFLWLIILGICVGAASVAGATGFIILHKKSGQKRLKKEKV